MDVHAFIQLHYQSCSNLASNFSSNGRWLCKTKRALSSSSSFNPVGFGIGRGWPDAPHSLNDRFHSLFPSCAICSLVLLQPNFIYILFNLLFHICFGLPQFCCPFTPSIIAFFKTLSSSFLTTILYSPLPFYLMFPPNPVFPSPPHYSFYPLILLHTLISPWLFPFFLRLPSRFPSNIICILFGNEGIHQLDSSDPILIRHQ